MTESKVARQVREMFGNSLAQEFQALVDVHGFSRDEIRTLILNAVRASWLPAERRRHLACVLQDDPDWRL
jgi:adenosine deaminase